MIHFLRYYVRSVIVCGYCRQIKISAGTVLYLSPELQIVILSPRRALIRLNRRCGPMHGGQSCMSRRAIRGWQPGQPMVGPDPRLAPNKTNRQSRAKQSAVSSNRPVIFAGANLSAPISKTYRLASYYSPSLLLLLRGLLLLLLLAATNPHLSAPD